MSKSIATGLFYSLAAVLFLWTASLTYSFVSSVLPASHWLVPIFALAIFDAGTLAWLYTFIHGAEGTGQRATALIMTIVDLIGLALIVTAETFIGGQTLVTAPAMLGEAAIWAIALWTVLNVGAVVAYHLLSPSARQKMALQAEKDQVFNEALERLANKRAAVSGQVSDALADGMLTQLLAELAADQKDPTTVGKVSANGRQPVTLNAEGNQSPLAERSR